MDTNKINRIRNSIKDKRLKLNIEKNLKKKQELQLKIQIEELRLKLEQLK